jgi:hypothetical protein
MKKTSGRASAAGWVAIAGGALLLVAAFLGVGDVHDAGLQLKDLLLAAGIMGGGTAGVIAKGADD